MSYLLLTFHCSHCEDNFTAQVEHANGEVVPFDDRAIERAVRYTQQQVLYYAPNGQPVVLCPACAFVLSRDITAYLVNLEKQL